MNQWNRRIVGLSTVLFLITVAPDWTVSARRDGPCDSEETHGAYTNVLCPNDHLLSGAYIKSPNENFRFYMQDDTAAVFDVSNFENWEFQYWVYNYPCGSSPCGNSPA
jgi:hypothetical protein